MAWPIPAVDPETIAVFPSSLMIILDFPFERFPLERFSLRTLSLRLSKMSAARESIQNAICGFRYSSALPLAVSEAFTQ
jgi:hypothetical protein